MNGTNARRLFDKAGSFFYANSEFLEFDALLESAASNNGWHFLGQLATVRASPQSFMHECLFSGLIILSEDHPRASVLCFLSTRSDGAARVRDGRGGNTMSVDALAATLGRGGEGKRDLRGQPCIFC